MKIKELADLIKIKNLNQRLLADKIGFSQTAISQAMTRKDMKVSMLEKIAKVLGVSPCIFLDDSEAVKNNGNISNGNNNKQIIIKGESYNVPVLLEKIKGLEKEVENKNEIIELLKNK